MEPVLHSCGSVLLLTITNSSIAKPGETLHWFLMCTVSSRKSLFSIIPLNFVKIINDDWRCWEKCCVLSEERLPESCSESRSELSHSWKQILLLWGICVNSICAGTIMWLTGCSPCVTGLDVTLQAVFCVGLSDSWQFMCYDMSALCTFRDQRPYE